VEFTASSTEKPTVPARSPYPDLRQAWLLILVSIGFQVAAAIPQGILTAVAGENSGLLPGGVMELFTYTLGIGLTIWFAFRKRGSRALTNQPTSALTYVLATLGLLAMGLLSEPIISALPAPDWLEELMKQMFTKNLVLAAVLAAPILEEILFRGVLLDGLLKHYSPTKAILWSGFFFGFIHFIPAQALNAMFIGFALGWLYYRTRSLTLCIFLHFVNNLISSLPLLFMENLDLSENLTRTWLGSDSLYLSLLAVSALVLLGCYYQLNRSLPEPKQA